MPQLLTEVSEPVNVLWYGDGGTGKTTSLATMANLGKVVVVNAEAGVKAGALRRQGIAVENIEVFPGPGEELTYDGLEAEWLRVREALDADPDAYAGFGLDSITEIYQALLADIVAKAVIKADRAGKERDPQFIALEDYGVMTQQVRSLVRKFRDLPCHFGMTALAKREQDDDGAVVYQPQVTAKLQNDLVGWVDAVCHTDVAPVGGVDEYRGLFRPHRKYRGKDRLGVLPKYLIDPTFERIVAYANEELTVDSDPVMQAAKQRAAEAKAEEAEAQGQSDETTEGDE